MKDEAREEQMKIIQKKAIVRFGYTADTPAITSFIFATMENLGYRQIPETVMENEWVDEPTQRGEYWVSPFVEGRYISPRILSVIDYQRPDRGIEIQYDFPHDTVPVKVFITEYYPKAKWLYIKEPELPTQRGS